MTVIENALDLAKKQREARTQHEAPTRSSLSSGSIVREPPPRASHVAVPAHPRLDFSALPQVPLNPRALHENRVLSQGSVGHGAEIAYRMLRTRVMRIMRNSNWTTLGIVASGAGEGKTLTALNLAISIAAEPGQHAVLVDLDLRRPMVNRYLGIPGDQFPNLSDFLEGVTNDVGPLLVSPGIPQLGCVMNSRPLERSSDLLASARGHMLIDGLKLQCPDALIVFDLPPLLATDDALVVAPLVDALLFVVAEGGAKRDEVMAARQLVQEFNVIGTLLNKSVEQDSRAYYYY
jgi:Mrp family chromosome partitioning ATPase